MVNLNQLFQNLNNQLELPIGVASKLKKSLKIIGQVNKCIQIYNLDNYLDPVLRTYFVCQQIAFCSLVVTQLYNIYDAIQMADIQRPNRQLSQGPRGGDIQLINLFPLYCFTLTSDLNSSYVNLIIKHHLNTFLFFLFKYS